jgi:hypothetical protein
MKLKMPSWKFRKKLRFDCFKFASRSRAGFGKPTNKVTFIDKYLNIEPMELKSKSSCWWYFTKVKIIYRNKWNGFVIQMLFEQLPTVYNNTNLQMKKIFFFYFDFTKAQQLNCIVTVDSQKLSVTNQQVLKRCKLH